MQFIAAFKPTSRHDPTANYCRPHVDGRSNIPLQGTKFQRDIQLNRCPAQTLHPERCIMQNLAPELRDERQVNYAYNYDMVFIKTENPNMNLNRTAADER
jgi:hypothetical protein